MDETVFIYGKRISEDLIEVPASSLCVLFTIASGCQKCPVNVSIVDFFSKIQEENKEFSSTLEKHGPDERSDPSHMYQIPVSRVPYSLTSLNNTECPVMVQNTLLPAVYSARDHWCVVGICASLRYIYQRASLINNDLLAKKLLGFRESCLHACAEVSCWTKFCEIEAIMALNDAYNQRYDEDSISVFPETVLRFENHLKRPPILHNALKRKQDHIRKTVKNKEERDRLLSKKLHELPELEHKFAEGLDMTLADVILFVCCDLITFKLSYMDFTNVSPLVLQWLKLIKSYEFIKTVLPMFDLIKANTVQMTFNEIVVPKIIVESLYKSDPERPKLHCTGSMTLQKDIDRVVSKLSCVEVNYESTENMCMALPWSQFPVTVHPQEGELPKSRLLRKCQQLENIVNRVIDIAKPGHRIVDFCSGGGHVGIVLAYTLPKCTILMVENKVSSLKRAKARIEKLGISNVEYYQCNLDYFCGNFDVGAALHACGQATDLVMQKCYEKNASFVCSPCCYGSIQPNHSVNYPRSALYAKMLSDLEEYLCLGHTADQTHAPDHPSTAQGQLCMRLIDADRLAHAKELGYETKLFLMIPVTCSPKNHLLVGTPENKIQK